jgi:TfoX/Sxy family transcriptional regulator of competence genes
VAYDETLAERARQVLSAREDVVERKMFGGIAWMVAGNMACGVLGDELVVRVGPDDTDKALAEAHTRPFEMGGRTSRGFVLVAPEATADEADLAGWVDAGADFAASLPPK